MRNCVIKISINPQKRNMLFAYKNDVQICSYSFLNLVLHFTRANKV